MMSALLFALGCLLLEGGGTLLHGLVLHDLPAIDSERNAVVHFLARDTFLAALATVGFFLGCVFARRATQPVPWVAFAAGIGFALGLEIINWIIPGSLLQFRGVVRTGIAWLYFAGASILAGYSLARPAA